MEPESFADHELVYLLKGQQGNPFLLRARRSLLHPRPVAPALPGPARGGGQEPTGAGEELCGRVRLARPARGAQRDGLPHGPRVRGQGPDVPEGGHEGGGEQAVPGPGPGEHGEHRAAVSVLSGGAERSGSRGAGHRVRGHEELRGAAEAAGAPGED